MDHVAYLEINHLNFTYAGSQSPALHDVDLTVGQGEMVLLAGASGCGKTTLLRLLKRQLRPNGTLSGDICLSGERLDALDERRSVADIGFVLQQPDAQIVTDRVWHELAFGLESLGERPSVIRRRVAEIAGFFGIGDLYHKSTAELSGGQKQLLNLASIMAMQPRLLLLDEPTAQLDPIAAADFLASLKRLNEELGLTMIIAEHRLEDIFPLCDRVVLMEQGTVRTVTTPRALCHHIGADEAEALGLPTAVRLFGLLGGQGDCPLTVREAKHYVEKTYENVVDRLPERTPPEGETVLELRDAWFRYERNAPDVLCGTELTVRRGEMLCVLGANGAGKTTLLRLLSGGIKPYRGRLVRTCERVAYLPQDPRVMFLQSTLMADWQQAATVAGRMAEDISALVERFELGHLSERHPYDVSGGEIQQAAMVKLMLSDPDVILLDEPTKGMGAIAKRRLSELMSMLCAQGKTVVAVTHDVEFAAAHADRCAMFFDGHVVAIEPTDRFFAENHYYTTAAARISRPHYQNAVTLTGLVELCRQNGKRRLEHEA